MPSLSSGSGFDLFDAISDISTLDISNGSFGIGNNTFNVSDAFGHVTNVLGLLLLDFGIFNLFL